MNKRKLLLTLLIALSLIVIIGTISAVTKNSFGYANITFNLPSKQNLNVTVNSKHLSITHLQATYQLPTGNNTLIATSPDYKQFKVNFKVTNGQTVYINVVMQSNAPQNQVVANQQVTDSLEGYLPQGFSLEQATYFYSNTWVVASVQAADGDQAVLVAEYLAGNRPWKIVLGPGTVFSTSDVSNLPNSVVLYMNDQGYVLNAGGL